MQKRKVLSLEWKSEGVIDDYESCAVSVQAGNQSSTLKPVILPEVMKSHHQQICELISCEKHHPQDHAKFFDKYADLISRQV